MRSVELHWYEYRPN